VGWAVRSWQFRLRTRCGPAGLGWCRWPVTGLVRPLPGIWAAFHLDTPAAVQHQRWCGPIGPFRESAPIIETSWPWPGAAVRTLSPATSMRTRFLPSA